MTTAGDDDDERTDPESPTGLRRSIAAQSNEASRLREHVSQLSGKLEEARAFQTRLVLEAGERDALLATVVLARDELALRLRFERVVSVILCVVVIVMLAYGWVSRLGWI